VLATIHNLNLAFFLESPISYASSTNAPSSSLVGHQQTLKRDKSVSAYLLDLKKIVDTLATVCCDQSRSSFSKSSQHYYPLQYHSHNVFSSSSNSFTKANYIQIITYEFAVDEIRNQVPSMTKETLTPTQTNSLVLL